MKLSGLQKFILKQAWASKDKTISKEMIEKFYLGKTHKPKAKDIITIITRSIERLIVDDLIIGYGSKTSHKWFIRQVKLTPVGKRIAKNLFGIQQILKLKSKKAK